DRREQGRVWRAPLAGQGRGRQNVARGKCELLAAVWCSTVVKDRAAAQRNESHVNAGGADRVQLDGRRSNFVDSDQSADRDRQAGRGDRGVRDATAELPAARIVSGDVAGRGANDDEGRLYGRAYTRSSHFAPEKPCISTSCPSRTMRFLPTFCSPTMPSMTKTNSWRWSSSRARPC